MNNNIQESYCSFEVSKLLKERGFDVKTSNFYDKNGNKETLDSIMAKRYSDEIILRPTISVALEWLWVNFGIFIQVDFHFDTNPMWFGYFIISKTEGVFAEDEKSRFKNPQKTYENALIHILKYSSHIFKK